MMAYLAFFVRYRVGIILGLTILVGSVVVPGFFGMTTLSLGLDRSASIGLIAIGLTVLLIAGQIDLSVGAVFALSGIVSIQLQPMLGIGPAAVIGVLAGTACGAINSVLSVVFRVNALVATLATMLIFRSVAHWMTNSQPAAGTDIMFSIKLAQIYFDIFTVRSSLFLAGIVLLQIWLSRSVAGRNLFAVGSSPAAAEASGISVNWTLACSFMFASTMAGIAGVLQSLATNTGSPVFGSELTVIVIAAVVVGGTRLEGGRGSALGTLGGVLTIASLTTAMEFQSVPAYIQQVVAGLILILLVVLDRTVKTRARAPVSSIKTA